MKKEKQNTPKQQKIIDPYSKFDEVDVEYVTQQDEQEAIQTIVGYSTGHFSGFDDSFYERY